MSDNKKKILEMLENNKINADEAYRLLYAIGEGETGQKEPAGAGRRPLSRASPSTCG